MIDWPEIGPPEIYPLVPEEPTTRLNCRHKIRIILIIVGFTLLLIVTMTFGLIMFKRFYQQKQTTITKEIALLTTVSTRTTGVSNISNNAQCPASNCLNSGTCCLKNNMWSKIYCCHKDIPVCCSPDQGWCCHIHAPVCCGNMGCCRLNTTCCTIQYVEQCCPISANPSVTIISTIVK